MRRESFGGKLLSERGGSANFTLARGGRFKIRLRSNSQMATAELMPPSAEQTNGVPHYWQSSRGTPVMQTAQTSGEYRALISFQGTGPSEPHAARVVSEYMRFQPIRRLSRRMAILT